MSPFEWFTALRPPALPKVSDVKKYATSECTWEKTAEKTEAVYKHIFEGGSK